MRKPYKADIPENTRDRIKEIIAAHNIPVVETSLGDGDLFCSCRISLTRDSDTSIGTNGKGMNRVYAQASGYAEFMERFQNRVIIYPNPANIGTPCRFFPDEKPYQWTHAEAVSNIQHYVPRVYPAEGLLADTLEGVSLPFYHVNSHSVVDVPYSLIRWVNGSNGMCAGNIREEALIQGFNEIFERYCIQEMYRRKITPPDVPLSTFKGTKIWEALERMKREYGMEYCIKDYSLGEGFPVLGLMVYSPDKQKYIMHLGADLNAEIALERCFTEIFQGYTAQTLTFENDVNDCERLDVFNEFKRSLMHGRGRLPKSFFRDIPSYQYSGHTTIPEGHNFREDLHNICHWVIQKGYDIYIRDNSFLGFPTLHIVVPGLSEMDHTFCKLNRRVSHMHLTENNLNPLFHLSTLTPQECYDTIDYLKQLDQDTIDLFTRNTNPKNHVNRHLILMLLYIATHQKNEAIQSMYNYERYCQTQGKEMKAVFSHVLALLNDKSIADEYQYTIDYKIARSLLEHPEQALHAISAPTCFDCEHCPVSVGCRYPLLQEIENISQIAMRNNIIKQDTLGEIFDEL